jgi:citrate lyase gamma subunit
MTKREEIEAGLRAKFEDQIEEQVWQVFNRQKLEGLHKQTEDQLVELIEELLREQFEDNIEELVEQELAMNSPEPV